jgi:transposase
LGYSPQKERFRAAFGHKKGADPMIGPVREQIIELWPPGGGAVLAAVRANGYARCWPFALTAIRAAERVRY